MFLYAIEMWVWIVQSDTSTNVHAKGAKMRKKGILAATSDIEKSTLHTGEYPRIRTGIFFKLNSWKDDDFLYWGNLYNSKTGKCWDVQKWNIQRYVIFLWQKICINTTIILYEYQRTQKSVTPMILATRNIAEYCCKEEHSLNLSLQSSDHLYSIRSYMLDVLRPHMRLASQVLFYRFHLKVVSIHWLQRVPEVSHPIEHE